MSVAAMLTACGGKANKEVAKTASLIETATPIDSMLSQMGKHVGDTIAISGTVRHTCKHSGRRCFISGDDRSKSIRIEAGGNIGGFNKELIGSQIAVKGVVKEIRTTKEDFLKYRAELEAQKAQGTEADHCESSIGDIDAKLAKMEQDGKAYWSDYYLAGIDMEN